MAAWGRARRRASDARSPRLRTSRTPLGSAARGTITPLAASAGEGAARHDVAARLRVGPCIAAVEVDLPLAGVVEQAHLAGLRCRSAAGSTSHACCSSKARRDAGAGPAPPHAFAQRPHHDLRALGREARQPQRGAVELQRRQPWGCRTATARSCSHWPTTVVRRSVRSACSWLTSRARIMPSTPCQAIVGQDRHDQQRDQHLDQREAACGVERLAWLSTVRARSTGSAAARRRRRASRRRRGGSSGSASAA